MQINHHCLSMPKAASHTVTTPSYHTHKDAWRHVNGFHKLKRKQESNRVKCYMNATQWRRHADTKGVRHHTQECEYCGAKPPLPGTTLRQLLYDMPGKERLCWQKLWPESQATFFNISARRVTLRNLQITGCNTVKWVLKRTNVFNRDRWIYIDKPKFQHSVHLLRKDCVRVDYE